jgi:probable F420-dependent oxidoreductase
VSPRVEGVLPFWLDRPDVEALDIAVEVKRAGLHGLWIGELLSFDAFALATAVGGRAPGLPLTLGPLAVGVRSPVALALGLASVATLTGNPVGIALGASSPPIVSGWHDRDWAHAASRTRDTVAALRQILAGERADYDGSHVRAHGFRLRSPRPDTRISVAAFGPAMTRVAARQADQVVLNLVPPERVRAVRVTVDAEARAAGRTPPDLAVWVPVALEPGEEARAQLAAQLAVYLGAPGYGELFAQLGFEDLVRRARAGARRSELARDVPYELLQRVGAVGTAAAVATRIAEYHDAGADSVGVAPSTAEDPRGGGVLAALSPTKELAS